MTDELVEQRRQDLLHQAERARWRASARSSRAASGARGSPPRGWRAAAGLALVRMGVRLGGRALSDSVIVVAGEGRRPASTVLVWHGHGGGSGRPPALSRR